TLLHRETRKRRTHDPEEGIVLGAGVKGNGNMKHPSTFMRHRWREGLQGRHDGALKHRGGERTRIERLPEGLRIGLDVCWSSGSEGHSKDGASWELGKSRPLGYELLCESTAVLSRRLLRPLFGLASLGPHSCAPLTGEHLGGQNVLMVKRLASP